MAKIVPVLIAICGVILLIGGASSYVVKSGSTAACEACGMEITKNDISTIKIVSKAGETHWACCPVCAMVVSLYYENATLHASCFGCGENVTIEFVTGNITLINPSDGMYNVTMIFGMSCMKNKLVCSNECANNVKTGYDWATGLPTKTMGQTLGIAQSKYSQFTVGYKPIEVPAITYGLIIGGVVLLVVSPLEWILVEKRKPAKESRDV